MIDTSSADCNTAIPNRPKRFSAARLRATTRPEPDDHDKCYIFNYMPCCEIEDQVKLTTKARLQASKIFDEQIQNAKCFKPYKIEEKRKDWLNLYRSLHFASIKNGCVRYGHHRSKTSSIRMQLIHAAAEIGLIQNLISPPGFSEKESRMIPTKIVKQFPIDPWEVDGERQQQFVFVRDRSEQKNDLPFDSTESTPALFQERLELINKVNSQFAITYRPYDAQRDVLLDARRQLRPIHFAIFSEDFHHHGRLYTAHYGHQSLRRLERQTILFEGSEATEIDYSGMHTRMAYHSEGIDYQKDPYELWGPDWGGNPNLKKPMRSMAKLLINTALNARTEKAAISACNQAMCSRDTRGRYKTGKDGETARNLWIAYKHTGLKFGEIYDLAMIHHQPIHHWFGSDAGMRLMHLDGRIALDILHQFALENIPCLGVHDSFIVPIQFFPKLKFLMKKVYRSYLHYLPTLKVSYPTAI